ncbi:type I-E CRISPR-associated protein Cse1/CasA [Filomicrobium sp.]|uniref:type I-E CRISPR-associated protein Cse1/CasA n=1 Tax=Filomicrobium sp. TaxID=2024831 RepID=UPI002586A80D|nr:type I-E CRISPR-associated protein Cse1/CasA [Filomicrobium sp.]MCV0369522.1 type I-E CRISPR-associated protein Cse1/CasA [Filomicrobium sp.]
METSFNLLREPWLPVELEDGKRASVRPGDISQPIDGQKIMRIASGRPDCDISTTEFLIGLLAVTFGPHDGHAWKALYSDPPSQDELEAALRPIEATLTLDGEGPLFFQDQEQLTGDDVSVEALFIDAPGSSTTRDNADHFVKRGRTGALSRAGAAIALLTLQTSAPSGGAGHRTSLRGGGPLTTLVLPGMVGNAEPTLWQRLWANVPGGMRESTDGYARVFPWVIETRVSDSSGVTTTPEDVHEAQAFFGMPRRIRLNFEPNPERRPCDLLGIVDDVIVTNYATRPWGANYVSWSRGHPLSPYYKPRETDAEYLPLHLKSSRVGYRQYLGLVVPDPDGLRVPARCVSDFQTRAQYFKGEERRALLNCRLLAVGYAMDNMKALDFGEALMPLVMTGDTTCDEQVRELAKRFITSADFAASQLISATKRALYGERGDAKWNSSVFDAVRNRIWSDTEEPFYRTLGIAAKNLFASRENLADQLAAIQQEFGSSWRIVLRQACLAIFDDAVPIEDAQSDKIKDVIEGRKMLVFALEGYGPVGKKIFGELSLPLPAKKPAKGRMAA